MSSFPIGIFDSGVGGLTIAHQCLRQFPQTPFLYFGDTARAPYGNKGAPCILAMVRENLRQMAEMGISAVLIACSTACAVGLPALAAEFPFPIVDVIGPGARSALEMSQTRKIGVLATRATVKSGAYSRAFHDLAPDADIRQIACPLLAAHIEEGYVDHAATRALLADYLNDSSLADVDTILLGCTHFAYLQELIGIIRPNVHIVDPATACAQELIRYLPLTVHQSATHKRWRSHFTDDGGSSAQRARAYLALLK